MNIMVGNLSETVSEWHLRELFGHLGQVESIQIIMNNITGRSEKFAFINMPVKEDAETARLRLLYVEPQARGLGLGKKLVSECTAFARDAGYKRIVLWTQSTLTAARKLYVAEGYKLIKQEPHHSFGKDLVGETWELVFTK